MTPATLTDINGVADTTAVAQHNFEQITKDLYKFTPTRQNDIETTIIGPPATGEHILNERWVDSLCAEWRCTAAGGPGTWRQQTPAVVATPPSSGTIPTGYQIVDASDSYVQKYHAGSYVWTSVNNTGGTLRISGGLLQLKNSTTNLWHTVTITGADGSPMLNISDTGTA